MTASLRHASSLTAIAIGIAAAIGAAAASPSWAATSSGSAAETGRQSELVNRPGCWTESGYDGRYPCELVGGR